MLLLAHAQFHYRDAAEDTITIADSRIIDIWTTDIIAQP